jgi:beta-glucanase (GH16 family)
MRKLAWSAVALLCACNPNKTVLDAEFHPTDRGWGSHQPVWQDEFDGTALNSNKWIAAEYCAGFTGEEQCYRPANATVSQGLLTITAKVESCSGSTLPADAQAVLGNKEVGTVYCPPHTGQQPFAYSSARIHTRISPGSTPPFHSWRFGRVEIRAKLPRGHGTWPALWMMPMQDNDGAWPASGEIDIMEAINLQSPHAAPDFIQSNVHLCARTQYTYYTPDPNPSNDAAQNCNALNIGQDSYVPVYREMRMNLPPSPAWQPSQPDLTTEFHTYALEWSDWDMRFYVDNKLVGSVLHGEDGHSRAAFRHDFYLIINLAVGGDWPTGKGQNPVNTANWLHNPDRAELVIDWVRVYSCFPDPLARKCIYDGAGLGEAP